MAQLHKIEIQTQIKSPPEKFFDIYKNKSHLMPKICPNKLQSIQVVEGDGNSVGSVRLWTYVMGGVPVIAKDKIVGVEEVNKRITYEVLGGEVREYLKTFKATLEGGVDTVKWSVEYEKASEQVPHPHSQSSVSSEYGQKTLMHTSLNHTHQPSIMLLLFIWCSCASDKSCY